MEQLIKSQSQDSYGKTYTIVSLKDLVCPFILLTRKGALNCENEKQNKKRTETAS